MKLLLVGVWVLCVSLGSSYVAATFLGASPEGEEATYFAGLDYRRTDGISVPIIADGQIKGYVLARFVYTIDGRVLSELAVPPEPFVLDEAFRTVYSLEGLDPLKPERYDLAALTDRIRTAVNERFGQSVVREVLVEQFDFLPGDEIGGERFRVVEG